MNPELKDVLDECNRIRKKLGLPPRRKMLKGVRFNGLLCSVAVTIGSGHMNTNSGWILANDDFDFGSTSRALTDFANGFDYGWFPELEKSNWRNRSLRESQRVRQGNNGGEYPVLETREHRGT